jgi:shikimate kinase
MAANVFKFTFSEVSYPDGRIGTIQASVKTTKKGSITVCGYYSDPNDQYLGQFQDTDNTSTDAVDVRDYCLSHFEERQ